MPEVARSEIVDVFREGFECWNAGELDLMQELYAEDPELDMKAVFTDTTPFCGRESMRRQWDAMWEAWEGVRMDPLEVFDLGRSRYAVDLRWWGKGKRSGVEVDQRLGCLYTIRPGDHKVIRLQLFPSVEDALRSAAATDAVA